MKKSKKNMKRRIQTIAVCGCLFLVAMSAGVTYRAFDRRHLEAVEQQEDMPVTAVKSPTVEVAAMEQSKPSNAPEKIPEEKPQAKQQETKPVFAYPLEGKVVLPYSVDHAIYDPTLEQYHTHASISISAEKGAEVKAAADGTVQKIAEDAETGKTVTIVHGENWLTTYGQLADTVKVKEGDKVKQGQTIGTVDAPTKYGAALGNHLEFSMEQNGEPKDPAEHLEKQE